MQWSSSTWRYSRPTSQEKSLKPYSQACFASPYMIWTETSTYTTLTINTSPCGKRKKRKHNSNQVITFLFCFFIVTIFKDHVHSPCWRIIIQSSLLSFPPVAEVGTILYQDIFYIRKLYQILESTACTGQPYSSDCSIQTLETDKISETSLFISYSLGQDHQLCRILVLPYAFCY